MGNLCAPKERKDVLAVSSTLITKNIMNSTLHVCFTELSQENVDGIIVPIENNWDNLNSAAKKLIDDAGIEISSQLKIMLERQPDIGNILILQGGHLKVNHLIFIVGPYCSGTTIRQQEEEIQMIECLRNALTAVNNQNYNTVSISILPQGFNGFSKQKFTEITLKTVLNFLNSEINKIGNIRVISPDHPTALSTKDMLTEILSNNNFTMPQDTEQQILYERQVQLVEVHEMNPQIQEDTLETQNQISNGEYKQATFINDVVEAEAKDSEGRELNQIISNQVDHTKIIQEEKNFY